MEYQFSSFEQWTIVLRSESFVRPPITTWCKQLLDAKLKVLNHFMHLTKEIKRPKILEQYVTEHYQRLTQLISDISLMKDAYNQILLKSLEQIKFFIELHFPDFTAKKNDFRMTTSLSIEEFAYMLNMLLEKEMIKTKSRKELARHVSRHIQFENSTVKETSTDAFYKVLLAQQRIKFTPIEEFTLQGGNTRHIGK